MGRENSVPERCPVIALVSWDSQGEIKLSVLNVKKVSFV